MIALSPCPFGAFDWFADPTQGDATRLPPSSLCPGLSRLVPSGRKSRLHPSLLASWGPPEASRTRLALTVAPPPSKCLWLRLVCEQTRLPFQHLFQSLHGPELPAADGGFGGLQDGGGFVQGQSFQEPQHEHLAMFLGQLVQGLPHPR